MPLIWLKSLRVWYQLWESSRQEEAHNTITLWIWTQQLTTPQTRSGWMRSLMCKTRIMPSAQMAHLFQGLKWLNSSNNLRPSKENRLNNLLYLKKADNSQPALFQKRKSQLLTLTTKIEWKFSSKALWWGNRLMSNPDSQDPKSPRWTKHPSSNCKRSLISSTATEKEQVMIM